MCKIKQLYVIIFLSFCFITNAQTLRFDNYTSKDGLISDEVYKIFQDKKGYIWMFTNYGTMKYNGKKFNQVLNNLPFNESFIYSYYENVKGEKWVVNLNCKIYEVKNDSAFLVAGTEKISNKLRELSVDVTDFVIDKDYNIYITTINGLYKFTKNKNYFHSIIGAHSKSDSTYGYILDVEDKIMFSINDPKRFINARNINMDFNIKHIEENNSKYLYSIKFKDNNRSAAIPNNFKRFKKEIYFSFYYNILKINADKSIKYIPVHSYILNYTKDHNNHLWVGTLNNGLYEFDSNDSLINHYFMDKTINHVLIDSQNGLWVSSDGAGLFHCKKMNEVHFGDDELLGKGINFIKKIDNRLFLANSVGDVSVIESGRTITVKSESKEIGEVLDVIKYNSGYIICYRYQLEFLQIKNKISKIKLPFIKPAFHPLSIFNFGHDSILCLSRGSFFILKDGIKSLQNKNVFIKSNHKLFACESRNSDKFLGTDDGVYLLNGNILFQPDYLLPTKKCKVVKITRDVFNNLWFCTKGYGLFKLTKKNDLIHYTVESGLPSNVINDISFNTDNTILLSTNIGLFQSSKFKKWIEVYPEQVKAAFGFKNDIYFTTKGGLIVYKDSKRIEQDPIYFNLASVLVNTNPIDNKQINKLSYKQNNIEFIFDIISFSSSIPDIIYQLNGNKNQIATTKNQHIIFQNLTPGNYTLTASLVANHIKSMPIVTSFVILPAFWQTGWFIYVCIITSLLVCIYIIWSIIKYYKNKENKKTEANRLITEYKLIALKAQINPHFMSNCLTAIQHLIISNKLDEANQYIAKFSFLVRQVLNFSTKNMVSLKEELEITELNIELEQLRFENKFDFEITWEDSIDLKNMLVPPLILQPIVENAIWHGLLPLKNFRNGKLLIKISLVEDSLFIVIEDNGIGRRKENQSMSNLRESKGIQIIKQRILNMNNLYNTNKGDFIIDDLTDELNNAVGTRITFILPLITID